MTRSQPTFSLFAFHRSHAADQSSTLARIQTPLAKEGSAPRSANVLLARYLCIASAAWPCSATSAGACSFQSFSEKTLGSGATCTTAAPEEVMTTRLTDVLIPCRQWHHCGQEADTHPKLSTLFRTEVVPRTAGTMASTYKSNEMRTGKCSELQRWADLVDRRS